MSGQQDYRPQTGQQSHDLYSPGQLFHFDSPFLFFLKNLSGPLSPLPGYLPDFLSPPFHMGIKAFGAFFPVR
jgi:hypothetical protein